jgi:hypothetical protein
VFRYLRFPTTIWGGLPPAGSQPGRIYRVTDCGVGGGFLVISDGSRWVPLGGMQLLARSAAPLTLTGTTVETALATVPIPAGLLGISGGLIEKSSWSYTNSANNKSLRLRFGGLAGSQVMAVTATATAGIVDVERRVRNRGSAASQICSLNNGLFSGGSGASAPTALAINTAVAQDLVFTGQLALAGESITLETYEVWATA